MQTTASINRSLRATRRRESISGYLFMAPALVFFLGFVVFPMFMCLALLCTPSVTQFACRHNKISWK